MNRYLVQDIETIPETELQADWETEKAKLLAEGSTRDTRFEPLWAHKVITIGMLVLDKDFLPVSGGCACGGLVGQRPEREMIQRWSDIASGKHFNQQEVLRMVDWHGAKFDVPVLQTRAFRYGIQLPWLFALQPDNKGKISNFSKEYRDRYKGKHYDVAELWSNRGMFQRPHMESLARLMGLPGKTELDGSQVYATFKDGRFADLDTYCMQDVIQTAFVFQRFCYMAGKITLEKYQTAARALLVWVGNQPAQEAFAAKIDRAAVLMETEPAPAVLSADADADHQGNDLISTGSGGDAAGPAVHSATGVRPEAG